jgi:hypothetical protein
MEEIAGRYLREAGGGGAMAVVSNQLLRVVRVVVIRLVVLKCEA